MEINSKNKKWIYGSEHIYFDGKKPIDWKNKPHLAQLELIESFVKDFKNKNVLEIGIGVGQDSKWFFDKGANIHALDISELFINHLKNITKDKGVYRFGDARNIKKVYGDKKFDIIYARWSLTPLSYEEFKTFLQDVYYLLNDKGKFHCSLTHGFGKDVYLKHLTGRLSLKLNIKNLVKIMPEEFSVCYSRTSTYSISNVIDKGRQFEFILEKNDDPKESVVYQK